MHVQCSLPYQIDFVSFLHLHLLCFYIFRFWTVCTVWTCSCYRAPGAKPVIPQDWALLYRYEWSVLLEKYILCFSIRNSASKMLKFFQHHKYTPSSLFYYFFLSNCIFLIMYVSCCSCGLQLSKQKHLLIGLIWKTTCIYLVRNKNYLFMCLSCGLLNVRYAIWKPFSYPL